MSLTLKILSTNGQPSVGNEEVIIDEQGGTIGRSVTNTLVLDDKNKIISRNHATLEFENGQYKLTDCSLGGTFIDNAMEPINNNSVQLVDGMQIKIGEYVIACTITNEPSPFLSPVQGNPFADDNAVNMAEQDELSNAVENKFNSPFSTNAEEKGASYDLLASVEKPSDSGLLSNLENNDFLNNDLLNNGLLNNDLLNKPDVNYTEASDLDHNNLLNTSGADFPETSDLEQNDLLNAASNSDKQSSHNLMAENISSLNDSFEPAKPVDNNPILDNSEIPENFNFEDLFNIDKNEAEPLVAENILDINQSNAQFSPSAASSQETLEHLNTDQRLPDTEQVQKVDIKSTVEGNNVVTNNVESNKVPPVNNDQLIQAFLRGVQMRPEDIEFSRPVEKMERIGEMLRQFTESTVAVLRSRAEFKSMFRVNVTTIQRSDNNPLKFAITTDDAIKHLINDEQVGFKESVESIDEGFNDLLNHQLAMQAGIQASINNILMQFSPAIIEKQYEEGIVLQKKSKCWDKYNLIYKSLSETAVEEFFGDAFSEAYEQQMKQLKK